MKLVLHPCPRSEIDPLLLILLPGLNIPADDFVTHGFIAALHQGESAVDALVAEADLDSYFDGAVARQIVTLIADRTSRPYRRIWLGGISLGCFGALLAASVKPETVEGAILLSPFLGTPGFIAEIERAGGFSSWQPGAIAADDHERQVGAWLKSHTNADGSPPVLHLGYGVSDRFATGAALLAARLPPRQLCVVAGAHDWPTWTLLWQRILAGRPFAQA
jgi:pimeloyl-ACP methyl ester carboxylesterase